MASIINASNSTGLTLTSDLSGTLQFQNNGVNLPMSGTAPTFSAYASSGTTIPTTTVTKVNFATKEFDTANCYSTSTSVFTPNVAGYYLVNVQVQFTGAIGGVQAIIRKNGADFKNGGNQPASTVNGYGNGVSAIIYLNGSTDYIEGCAFQWSGSNATIQTGQQVSYFQASLIRGA